jgi:predicted patatin/cPLA2 family phospholipase
VTVPSSARLTAPPPQWTKDHPVLEAIRQRRADGSLPGKRTDGHKIALAVEGGGLRGIVSAGMLSAIEDIGLRSAFDVIYSCSSGAVNSAYFLGGDTWYPLSIYYEDLTNKQFLDFRRAFRGQPVMNLSFALDEIVEFVKPLDYKAVLASPVPMYIMVCDVDNLVTRAVSDFASAEDMKSALRASMWLPLAVPGAAQFRGYRAIDGGTLTAHPFMYIQRNDPSVTHVLSLSTRPMGSMRGGVSWLNRYVGYRLNRLRAGLGSAYVQAVRDYKTARREIEAQRMEPQAGPYILDLAPLPQQLEVIRHEMNPWLLIQGARDGYEVVYYAVEGRYRRSMPRLLMPGHGRDDFIFPNRHEA